MRGEITGFTRIQRALLLFDLKDANGQLRCAMFRAAGLLLTFARAMGNWWKCAGAWGV